jgi:hypothetical protein
VPDWDNTESRERDEDAAWRDLVARYDTPLTTQQPVPWPKREDVAGGSPGTREVSGADGLHGDDGSHGDDGASGGHEAGGDGAGQVRLAGENELAAENGLAGQSGVTAENGQSGVTAENELAGEHGLAGTREAEGPRGTDGAYGGSPGLGADGMSSAFDSGFPETLDPDVIQTPRVIRGPVARRAAARAAAEDDDEEHYIPPVPPPLPKLDPLAKGAWAALFGGPGYLVVATVAGWSVSGFAAFCAVAAFVAGFAILVLRMNDPGPGGPDDGDDGAVV